MSKPLQVTRVHKQTKWRLLLGLEMLSQCFDSSSQKELLEKLERICLTKDDISLIIACVRRIPVGESIGDRSSFTEHL